jgi:hypothetical protein
MILHLVPEMVVAISKIKFSTFFDLTTLKNCNSRMNIKKVTSGVKDLPHLQELN